MAPTTCAQRPLGRISAPDRWPPAGRAVARNLPRGRGESIRAGHCPPAYLGRAASGGRLGAGYAGLTVEGRRRKLERGPGACERPRAGGGARTPGAEGAGRRATPEAASAVARPCAEAPTRALESRGRARPSRRCSLREDPHGAVWRGGGWTSRVLAG